VGPEWRLKPAIFFFGHSNARLKACSSTASSLDGRGRTINGVLGFEQGSFPLAFARGQDDHLNNQRTRDVRARRIYNPTAFDQRHNSVTPVLVRELALARSAPAATLTVLSRQKVLGEAFASPVPFCFRLAYFFFFFAAFFAFFLVAISILPLKRRFRGALSNV
jgi:hypothetical protein